MGRALGRGSAIDASKSVLGVLREFAGDAPADSALRMRELVRRKDDRDLMTSTVSPGPPTFDFELPQHDFSGGAGVATGATVRRSRFRGVRPVAVMFGSCT
jgi:hypothetical protein